jgi:hypothetical protein
MKLQNTELHLRLPVWSALAELFADSELSTKDKQHLAIRLRESRYSVEEIELILRDEVFPTFGGNLLTTAGNWTGWSDEEVQQRVLQRLDRGVSESLQWWRRWRLTSLVGHDWHEIKQRMAQSHPI